MIDIFTSNIDVLLHHYFVPAVAN